MNWGAIGVLVTVAIMAALFVRFLLRRKHRNALRSLKKAIGRSRETLLSDAANKATVPLLDAAEFGYQTTFQEKLLAVQEDVTQMEFTGSGLVRTGGVAVSMPVGVAGRYRVSSGSVRSRRAWQAVAKGRLLITDRAIIFDGDGLRERITWGKVSEIETRVDGYEVIKLGDPPRTYAVSRLDTNFAAILELMLVRTD